jgi:hypothetical protein
MMLDWTPLDSEMAHWQAAGLSLPLWWRDDDAIAPTPQLQRLSDLSDRLGLSVHLSVIPAEADADLARFVQNRPQIVPIVHGFAHRNHAPSGQKKTEFGDHRPVHSALNDARVGVARLQDLFGSRLRPIFVPPWNRIDPGVVQGLAPLGYRALSTFKPRTAPTAAPGLEQINTHLDPIHWRGSRSLAPAADLIAQVAQDLRDRRSGVADNREPYGILTHHLVHDEPIWSFTETLITRLLAGPTTSWTFPADKDTTP